MKSLLAWFKALSAAGKAGVILAAFIGIGIVGAAGQPPANSHPPKPSTPKTSQPTVTIKTAASTKPIAFTSTTVQDSTVAQGTSKVTTTGVDGVETLTYQDTYTNGKQTAHKLISDVVTSKPVTQVTSIGTYVATAPQPKTSCTPLTNGGNCYEPGEYCRNSDHGSSGIAGDGKSITCIDNNGWRWEPN